MKILTTIASIAGIVTLFTTGCASSVITGATTAGRWPEIRDHTYRIASCSRLDNNGRDRNTGRGIPGLRARIFIANEDGQPVLYAMSSRVSGMRVTNHWVDEQGDNFLLLTMVGAGFHFVLPRDRSQPGVRNFLFPGQFRFVEAGGRLRLAGTSGPPHRQCVLSPGA